MKIIKKGEKSRKSTVVDLQTELVVSHHTSQHPELKGQSSYQQCWTLDFSSTPLDKIYELSAKSLIITIRRTFAADEKPTDDDWNDATFDAMDYITERVSKMERAVQLVAGMDAETLAKYGLVKAT